MLVIIYIVIHNFNLVSNQMIPINACNLSTKSAVLTIQLRRFNLIKCNFQFTYLINPLCWLSNSVVLISKSVILKFTYLINPLCCLSNSVVSISKSVIFKFFFGKYCNKSERTAIWLQFVMSVNWTYNLSNNLQS